MGRKKQTLSLLERNTYPIYLILKPVVEELSREVAFQRDIDDSLLLLCYV